MKRPALALLLALAAGSAWAGRLRVVVRNPTRTDLEAWPLTTGVPWPQGELDSVDQLRLVDPLGEEAPLQAGAVSRWPDGSVKWALLDFQATVQAGRDAAYRLHYGPNVQRQAVGKLGLVVDDTPEAIVISSGPATFTVAKSGFSGFQEVALRGQRVTLVRRAGAADGLRLVPAEEIASTTAPGDRAAVPLAVTERVFLGRHAAGARWFRRRGFRVVAADTGQPAAAQVVGASLDPEGERDLVGSGIHLRLDRAPGQPVRVFYPRAAADPTPYCSSLGPATVAIETRGALRTVLRVAGQFQSAGGARLCEYVARLHFFAGKAAARLELTLLNREPLPLSQGLETYPLLVRELTFSLPLRLLRPQRFCFAGSRRRGTTHRGEIDAEDDRAELVQYASRCGVLARYVVTRNGKELAQGTMAHGAVGLRDDTQGAVVAVKRFWGHNPKSLSVHGERRIEVGILPAAAGPAEELVAGRARTCDLLVLFHGKNPPRLPDRCAAFDSPAVACVAPDDGEPYTGRWYSRADVLALAPLGTSDGDLLFDDDLRTVLASHEGNGAYGTWHFGDHGTAPCPVVRFAVDHADPTCIFSPRLFDLGPAEGLALRILSGKAAAATRAQPPRIAANDPALGSISLAKPLSLAPERGARAALYPPHGSFLCHRFGPAYALAREHLRRGRPRLLHAAHTTARHLADVGTFHGVRAGPTTWIGACHDPGLGPTAHHAPGLSHEASWYAGPWLVFLLTGDRTLLDAALANAVFAARHATPLAAALAVINLCHAADVAPVFAPDLAPSFRAALESHVDKLLDAQRHARHGLHGERGAAAGLVLEALDACRRVRPDDARLVPSVVRAAEALIRPDRFWAGHGTLAPSPAGEHGGAARHYATVDGLVLDRSVDRRRATWGFPAALVAPHLAAATRLTGDTKYIKKARRLERVATLFRVAGPADFALRRRQAGLFHAQWQHYRKAHPPVVDEAIAFQCRLENAADVVFPDVGEGGCVFWRPFVARADGTRALQAQAPGLAPRAGMGLWFPLAGSGNVVGQQGILEFRICYRKGPGALAHTWLASGEPQRHGFALTLTSDGLEFLSHHRGRFPIRILARAARPVRGTWHRVAVAWRPFWGTDLLFDGKKVGHHAMHRIGFGRRLRFPCIAHAKADEYLIDDFRILKKRPDVLPPVPDATPPAAITDLRLEPDRDGKFLLTWTAPGDDGTTGVARRYDIRTSTQRIGPISWGGYAASNAPVAAVHWAEADRLASAPKPQAAGRLEKLQLGPFPKDRRIYVAIKAEDEANVSPLSNVVATPVNHPPVADPGPRLRQVVPGTTVHFSALASSDSDYDDLTYQWSHGIAAATGSRVYRRAGAYDVTLTVSDGKATHAATARVVVARTVRISFQPAAAAVPKDFVADTGQCYTTTRGTGWRRLSGRAAAYARPTPTTLPPEARSGLRTPRAAEWLFDLPNGTYRLTLAVGDPAHLGGRRRILVEGKDALDATVTRTEPSLTRRHTTRVADGQLTLHVGAPPTEGEAPAEGGEISYLIIESVP